MGVLSFSGGLKTVLVYWNWSFRRLHPGRFILRQAFRKLKIPSCVDWLGWNRSSLDNANSVEAARLSASHRRFRRAMCTCKQNEAERGKKGGRERQTKSRAMTSSENGKLTMQQIKIVSFIGTCLVDWFIEFWAPWLIRLRKVLSSKNKWRMTLPTTFLKINQFVKIHVLRNDLD